ncbi:MAG: hypothetical protein WBB19_11470 [Desulforhopalus sp.]
MKSRYESIVWVKDEKGEKYVCPIDDFKGKKGRKFEQLTEEEKKHCSKNGLPWN